MILFSICDIPWWLLWLLPLLAALLFWWWQTKKYNDMVAEYEDKIKGLNVRIRTLEEELSACKAKRSELEGDLALTKGRMREMESEMNDLRSSSGDGGESGGISNVASAGLGAVAASLSNNDTDEDTSGSDADSGGDSGADLSSITSSLAGATSGSAGISAGGSGSGGSSMYAKVKSDNLQIIEGIGPKMESILKENGIDSHTTLGSKSLDEIQAILDKYGDRYKIIDPKTWASQAKMAGDGDFDGLIAFQKNLNAGKDNATGSTDSKLEKYLIKIGVLKAFKQDDLKAIEGIGPATDKLLRDNGINTWRELANSTVERIQEILKSGGSRFALGDPSTWPKQAKLAADGKFDELREYQDYLDGGKG